MHKHLHALARACTYTHTHTRTCTICTCAHSHSCMHTSKHTACTHMHLVHAQKRTHAHVCARKSVCFHESRICDTLLQPNGTKKQRCTHAPMHTCMHSTHTHKRARMHTITCTPLHALAHTHTHTHMHDLHLRACTHAHSHSCMHTSKHTACTYMHLVHAQKRTHAHECTRKSICFHESHICDSEDSAGDSGKKNNGRQNRQTDR